MLALCASSETEKLSLDERVELAKYIMANRGKLVIIASGHVSDSVEDQLTELNAMADAGVDGLCLIVGRLNQHNETEDEFIENIKVIMDGINNKEIPLGFYETVSYTHLTATLVSAVSPIGPRACSFCVEMPISAPSPNSLPSVKRVEALT